MKNIISMDYQFQKIIKYKNLIHQFSLIYYLFFINKINYITLYYLFILIPI